MLSKSDLVFGDIIGLWEKNFYHRLLEMDNPAAIQNAPSPVIQPPIWLYT
jgi:hypothetical protein